MAEEESAGRRWSTERTFGALNCSVDRISDSEIDSKGEDARVEGSPISNEAIKSYADGAACEGSKVKIFPSSHARWFICIH